MMNSIPDNITVNSTAPDLAAMNQSELLFEARRDLARRILEASSHDEQSNLLARIQELNRVMRPNLRCPIEMKDEFPKLRAPVIDGLIRESEIGTIIAAPKNNKSWLANGLALSVASGKPWLDRFEVNRGKVLIVDNELHNETITDRLHLVQQKMGLSNADIQGWCKSYSMRGKLEELPNMGPFFESIEGQGFKLIILDAWYRFLPSSAGSENDNSTITQCFNLLDRWAQMLNCAFLLIHHTSKGDQSDKKTTDIGAGAGAQSRAADTHLVIQEHEHENHAVINGVVRSFAPVDPISVEWDFPTWRYADLVPIVKPRKTRSESKTEKQDLVRLEDLHKFASQKAKAKTKAKRLFSRRECRNAIGCGPDATTRVIKKAIDLEIIEFVKEETRRGQLTELFQVHSDAIDNLDAIKSTADQGD